MTPLPALTLGALLALATSCGASAPPPTRPAGAPAQTGTIPAADGNPIYYRSDGAGEPAVLLVHFWGGTSDEWAEVIPTLAATRRVIAVDLPGHGRSGKRRAAWTVDAYVDDLRAVLDGLRIQRAAIVGHSMSGTIAVAAAAAMPDRITKVVPIDSVQDATYVADPAAAKAFLDPFRADFPAAVAELARSNLPPSADPALAPRITALILANDPKIAIPILEANATYPLKDAFAKVKVPIVDLNGDVWPTNVAANRALSPRFDARIMKDTGHWPMFERPGQFTALLAEVLAAP